MICCKDCKERHYKCHSECEKYKAGKEEDQKIKAYLKGMCRNEHRKNRCEEMDKKNREKQRDGKPVKFIRWE